MPNSDAEMQDSQELYPPSQINYGAGTSAQPLPNRRWNTGHHSQRDDFTSNILSTVKNIERLSELDNEKTLGIWNFIDEIEEDSLVKQYYDLLFNAKWLPKKPDTDDLRSLPSPDFILPVETQVETIHLLTSYFQCCNFNNHTTGATENNVALFNPHNNFNIPMYDHLPQKFFTEMVNLKQEYAISLQQKSITANQFTKELLLLQAFNKIFDLVKVRVDTRQLALDFSMFFYTTFYLASKTNFAKKYKLRMINWNKRETKVRPSLPGWRKEEKELPAPRKNRYAINLENDIRKGRVTINANDCLKEYNSIRSGEKQPDNYQNPNNHNVFNFRGSSNKSRIDDETRLPVKPHTKQRTKYDKRGKNSKFVSNRGLPNDVNLIPDSEAFNNID